LQFEVDLGQYQGTTERSFIIYAPPGEAVKTSERIKRLARLFNQETFIHVDAVRCTHLHLGSNGTFQGMLGKWQELEAADAATLRFLDSWTKTADGRYWIAA
jgi:hypothetical protein